MLVFTIIFGLLKNMEMYVYRIIFLTQNVFWKSEVQVLKKINIGYPTFARSSLISIEW